MENLARIVGELPFFDGISPGFRDLIAGCVKNARFAPGDYLFRAGGPADAMYLIRAGRVALEVSAPGRGTVVFQTLGEGDLAGLSWLVPPWRWTHDARAMETVRAIAIDAACLRGKCEADPALGYEMMKRFMPVLVGRLHATRLQMLDVYG